LRVLVADDSAAAEAVLPIEAIAAALLGAGVPRRHLS
jgi:hypothetical protein